MRKVLRWISVILRTALVIAMMLLCAVLFYVIVIMGDTANEDYMEEAPVQVGAVVEVETFEGADPGCGNVAHSMRSVPRPSFASTDCATGASRLCFLELPLKG